jgi:hypothetical protein
MNRRTALQSLSVLAAGVFGVGQFAGAGAANGGRPPGIADDYGVALSPEELQEQKTCDLDRMLLLPAVWEVTSALNEIELWHRECPGCHICLDASAILFHAEVYESIFASEVIWSDAMHQEAEADRGRRQDRTKGHPLESHSHLRALVALNGFEDVLKGLLGRHEECSCMLCRDASAMCWQVSQWTLTAFAPRE